MCVCACVGVKPHHPLSTTHTHKKPKNHHQFFHPHKKKTVVEAMPDRALTEDFIKRLYGETHRLSPTDQLIMSSSSHSLTALNEEDEEEEGEEEGGELKLWGCPVRRQMVGLWFAEGVGSMICRWYVLGRLLIMESSPFFSRPPARPTTTTGVPALRLVGRGDAVGGAGPAAQAGGDCGRGLVPPERPGRPAGPHQGGTADWLTCCLLAILHPSLVHIKLTTGALLSLNKLTACSGT